MLLGCPLIIITLGLFTLVHQRRPAGLQRVDRATCSALNVEVDGFWAAFLGALLISFVSLVLSLALNPIKRKFA